MNTTTAKKPTATERRLDAMRRLSDGCYTRQYRDADDQPRIDLLVTVADKHTLAAAIRELAALGKTDRWTGAVEAWAAQVELASDDDSLRWAFQQYAVWTGYAA